MKRTKRARSKHTSTIETALLELAAVAKYRHQPGYQLMSYNRTTHRRF